MLDGFEYSGQDIEITSQVITEIRGRQLTGDKWVFDRVPQDFVEAKGTNGKRPRTTPGPSNVLEGPSLRSHAKRAAGRFSADAEGVIYKHVLAHVSKKFMGGKTLGLASLEELRIAERRIGLALSKIAYTPGLLQGMVLHGS
ncbi:MAG: hypothetical protein IPI85_15975 [Dehalococcoidia bacterium]|nr:hypothetical protein [Dehalococcoidia bacterium]